jgi:hypothetical protein
VAQPVRRFPDVQAFLVDDLQALAGAGHTGVQTPANLAELLPFTRVRRIGGGSDRIFDRATVDVDWFDGSYTAAEMGAEMVRQRLVGPPPPVVWFDAIDCPSGPQELPWGDGSIRRFGATYQISTRRYIAYM